MTEARNEGGQKGLESTLEAAHVRGQFFEAPDAVVRLTLDCGSAQNESRGRGVQIMTMTFKSVFWSLCFRVWTFY